MTTRTARVLRENVECPSLSPDGTRIAFKKHVLSQIGTTWRLTVLDLSTLTETALAETRGVDDQATWLDNSHILYGLSSLPASTTPPRLATNLWEVAADGSGTPQQFLLAAWSPAIVG